MSQDDEDELLRSVALQNATVIRVERQRAEEALVRAKEALEAKTEELAHALAMTKATLESTTDGILATDDAGNVTACNESFVRMWRLSPATMEAGRHPRILEVTSAAFDDPARFVARVQEIYATSPQDTHDVLELSDGQVFERFSRPQLLGERNVGRVWSFRDVTSRRRAERRERALHEEAAMADARFRAFFDQGPLFAGIMNLDGTLVETNRLALEACGYTKDDVVGRPFWECPWWSPSPALMEQVRKGSERAAAGEPFRAEVPYFVADGGERLVDLHILPIEDAAGRVLFLAPTGTDITERRNLETQLRRLAADLSEADRRKNEFLAMLAHELRNPLAPLRNALRIVRMNEGDATVVTASADMMERQVVHMVRLVDDLLDVSRITLGKIELRMEPQELASIVHHAIEGVRPLINTMRHQLAVALPDRPIYLDGDPIRLAQVISNLLSNACKYTEAGGRISLVVARDGATVVIAVRDSGIGIAADQIPVIFDMFMQVDPSLERSQSGLGIGLTLVKQLVEMHHGSVEVRSPGIGHGSEFVVRLPALPEGFAPATPAVPFATAATTPRRILIVDDNADAALSLSMLLEMSGNQIRTAFDGAEAVATAAAFRPEVVVLDLGLPVLNGYEAARKIREQPWGKDMILIALTGWGQEEDRQRSSAAGFDAHMVKPIYSDALVTLLGTLLPASR